MESGWGAHAYAVLGERLADAAVRWCAVADEVRSWAGQAGMLVDAGWEGPGARAYRERAHARAGELAALADRLESVSAGLAGVAEALTEEAS